MAARTRRRGKSAAFGDEESVGGDAQGRVMMESAPPAPLVVAEAEFLLEVLIVALDAPAQLGLIGHGPTRDRGRQGGEPVFGGFRLAFGPLDQEPLLGAWGGAVGVAMGGSDPDRGKAPGQGGVGALAPDQPAPGSLGQACSQHLGRHGGMLGIAPDRRRWATTP